MAYLRTPAMSVCVLVALGVAVEAQRVALPRGALQDLSASLEAVTERVAPSVVQVQATGYGAVDPGSVTTTELVVAPQRRLGSGVIVDPSGYIITNAHVVSRAKRVQVTLWHSPTAIERIANAEVIGVADELDLALLKINATGLTALPPSASSRVRPGAIVLAFGSPDALQNSVTLGVASAVARQLDLDSPAVYIQTDAAINPGNSGGPLVNIDGELVGISTFIVTHSGGSEGLGFAVPAATVAATIRQLRKYGGLHRGVVGIQVQAVTPSLSSGLHLPSAAGVIVADVVPDSPADIAGVQAGDVIANVDGHAVTSVPTFADAMNEYGPGDQVTITVVRMGDPFARTMTVAVATDLPSSLIDAGDPDDDFIRPLGIVAVDVDGRTVPLVPTLREPSGVLVTVREDSLPAREVPLQAGDVIHSVNGLTVRSVDGLRVLLDGMAHASQAVLRIERNGHFRFVTAGID